MNGLARHRRRPWPGFRRRKLGIMESTVISTSLDIQKLEQELRPRAVLAEPKEYMSLVENGGQGQECSVEFPRKSPKPHHRQAWPFPAFSSPSPRAPVSQEKNHSTSTRNRCQFYVAKGATRGEIIADAQIWCDYVDFYLIRFSDFIVPLPKSANMNLGLVHKRQPSSKERKYDAAELHVHSLLANVTWWLPRLHKSWSPPLLGRRRCRTRG